MGLLDDPSTEGRILDMTNAKEAIEVLRVIERKTKGNQKEGQILSCWEP